MTLQYTYPNRESASAAIPDGEVFFKPIIEEAIAKLPDEVKPFADGCYKVVTDQTYGNWRSYDYRVVVSLKVSDRGLRISVGNWCSTKFRMRKNGTVNQDRIDELVSIYAFRMKAEKERRDSMTDNLSALDAVNDPDLRDRIKATGYEGTFEYRYVKHAVGLFIQKSMTLDQARAFHLAVVEAERGMLAALGNE